MSDFLNQLDEKVPDINQGIDLQTLQKEQAETQEIEPPKTM